MEPKRASEMAPGIDKLEGNVKVYLYGVRRQDLNMWDAELEMDGYKTSVMIRKGGTEINKSTYDMLKNFQHECCIRHLEFYRDGNSNSGRLIVPVVKISFTKWIKNDGKEHLFDDNGIMSVFFRSTMADLCDMIIQLNKKGIMIKKFNVANLYLANEESPRVLLLVTEAEKQQAISNMDSLKPVADLIQWCHNELGFQVDYDARRYMDYLTFSRFSLRSLRMYPYHWNYHEKGDYLLSLFAAKKKIVQVALSKAGVSWPSENGELPQVLAMIIEYQKSQPTSSTYIATIAYDYLRLLRDTFQHFADMPHNVKNLIGSQQGLIDMVDKWSPTLWFDIYDEIGL